MSVYWIQTFTGKRFDLLEPTLDMICIEDIAHHLSIENRFHGATKFAYSVGYHSVLGVRKIDDAFKLDFLFHDAHEAYYKDLSTDWKRLINVVSEDFWYELMYEFDALLNQKFLLDLDSSTSLIHEVDIRMCKTEKLQLMIEGPAWDKLENVEPYNDIQILQLQPQNVEQLFLKEYEKWRRI